MPPTIQELREKRRQVAQQDMYAAYAKGYTGSFNPDGTMTASPGPGLIYVRIGATKPDDRRPATRVNNAKVQTASNLPVLLWKPNGKWAVFDLDTEKARLQLGAKVGNANTPTKVGDYDYVTVNGRRFKDGRVRVFDTGTLKLNAEPFSYMDSVGDHKTWLPTPDNALDVTSEVPAAVSGVDQGVWVWLALTPDATTPALEAFTGTSADVLFYDPNGWQSITIPDGYYPLDAVWLQTGDTTITSENRYASGRLFLDKLGGGTGVQSVVAGTNVTVDNADPQNPIVSASGGGGGAGDYILIRDEQTQNTSGGTATSGSWETRTLNTEVADTGSHASLSSNQVTLLAGTYRIRGSAPAFQVGRHRARWENVTDGTTVSLGTSEFSGNAAAYAQTRSIIEDRFTIAGTKVFELQHKVDVTKSTQGYGVESNFSTEIYSIVELIRE